MKNTFDVSKLAGFLQGLLYPIAMLVLAYIVQNLGASGIFPIGIATIITGLLSVLENAIQQKTGRALFGALK